MFLAAIRAPRTVALLWFLALALLGSQIPNIRVALSVSEIVEPAFHSVQQTRTLHKLYGEKITAFLIVRPSGEGRVLTPDDLGVLEDWIEQQRKNNPDVARIFSAFDIRQQTITPLGRFETPLVHPDSSKLLRPLADSPWANILTDSKHRDFGFIVEFNEAPSGSKYGSFDPDVLGNLIADLEVELAPASGLVVQAAGVAAFQHYSLEGIRTFQLLNIGMLLGLVVIMRYLFGSWTSGFLLVGILGVAGVVVYGLMSLLHVPIDFLSTGLFLMISVAALSDYLFITYQQLRRPARWRSNFRVFLLPSFFTSLTTFIGFTSLYASDLHLVQRFGLLAGAGALVEWLIMFTLLPAILALVPALRNWRSSRKLQLWRGIDGLVARRLPRKVALSALAVYLLAGYSIFNLNVSDSLTTLFPRTHPYHQSFDYLLQSRGWQGEVSLIFPAGVSLEVQMEALGEISSHPNVAFSLGAQDVLDYIFRGGVRVRGENLELEPESGLNPLIRTYYAKSGETRHMLYLKLVDAGTLDGTLSAISASCRDSGCIPAGDLVVFADYSNQVPDALLKSFSLCLLLVAMLLGYLCLVNEQRRNIPSILLAAFWGPAVMLSLLWALQINVSFLTCVFASVLVGLTGDNFIQYLFARGSKPLFTGVGLRGAASVQVALVMGLVSLTFLGSSFVPSRILGLLLALGLLMSVVGDLWILKSLVGYSLQSTFNSTKK